MNAVEARKLNNASGGNGWTCFGGPGLSETRPDAGSVSNDRLGAPPWISAWVPGHTNNDTPTGTGVLVHKDAVIVMQVHYNLIHKAQRDRSHAVIRFAPAAQTKLTPLNTLLIAAPVELPCPRGTSSPLCSRERGGSGGDPQIRLRGGRHPGRPALPVRQVPQQLSELAGEREVARHRLLAASDPAATDLRRRRPHAHPRLRHPGRP